MKTVLVRADGSASIGLGHIMRCLTLAGALKERQIRVVFVSRDFSEKVAGIIKDAGFGLKLLPADIALKDDLDALLETAREVGASGVICDGYFFEEWYFEGIKDAGLRLMTIGGRMTGAGNADIVLNQNIYATPETYEGFAGPDTKLLLGTRYSLVRSEFVEARATRRPAAEIAREILVTLGGSDPTNCTLKVLKALDAIVSDVRVTVVLGSANPFVDTVRAFSVTMTKNVELVVGAKNMAELMAGADMAVTASGTTSWEAACVGLPTVTVSLADNQEPVGIVMGERGIAVYLGRDEDVSTEIISSAVSSLMRDRERRAVMSAKGMELVDGKGAYRVAEALAMIL